MVDVVIIGGGISGCSMLYALSKYNIDVVLLEKENDVGVGTTKANSAIIHAGYDPKPGTQMASYNVRGNELVYEICQNLDILYKKTGSLVLGFSEDDKATLQKLYTQGIENGVPELKIINQEELRNLEPNVSENAIAALYAGTGGVVNPWELASAQAEVAVQSGAKVYLNTQVNKIKKTNGNFIIETNNKIFETKFVINAAGVNSDLISSMIEKTNFTIMPNKGQYYLLDTTQGNLVQRVIFQCPTKEGKGVLVAPTVHGNLIVGPNAEDTDRNDTSTTAQGLEFVKKSALKSVPTIQFRESIRNFSGIRAATNQDDFIVGESEQIKGFYNIAGIKSPGLTAAPAIAEDVTNRLLKAGLNKEENKNYIKNRKIFRFKYATHEERANAVKENPNYGIIVCRCETITEGEIIDALHRPLPPASLDAVKRRCSPGMGRCQGGFCGPKVQEIIARELGIEEKDIPLDRQGMNIITGRTKQGETYYG